MFTFRPKLTLLLISLMFLGTFRVFAAPTGNEPALVSLTVSPNPAPRTGTVTFTTVFTDPQGGGTIDRAWLGFTNCSNNPAEAYNSNFERNLANYFGAVLFPQEGLYGVSQNNVGAACTGGQFGDAAWGFTAPLENIPGTATLTGVTKVVVGNNLNVYWTVQLNNFPAGTYNRYFMVRDHTIVYQTGGGAEWWHQGTFTVVNPTATPTKTPTKTPTITPTRTPTITPTKTATVTKTPTPTTTLTQTPTPSKTVTPTGTKTHTPTVTKTPTPSSTLSPSPTPTKTITPSPTLTPTYTPSPTPTVPSIILTDRVNYYRSLAALNPVTFLPNWDEGCTHHAQYMVENNLLTHTESYSNPWYTPDGAAAAQASNLLLFEDPLVSAFSVVDQWMANTFHAVSLLEPRLVQSGFGLYRNENRTGSCLDVSRGIDFFANVIWPVKWPNGWTPVSLYSGNGTPDPLTSCSGYTAPSGPPVILMLGDGTGSPVVNSYSFSGPGGALQACVFTETTYTNPDPVQQATGRNVLNQRDAIVLIPRNPLAFGETYSVSITANGQIHNWAFTVAPGGVASP